MERPDPTDVTLGEAPEATGPWTRLDAWDRRMSTHIVIKPRKDGRTRHWVYVLRRFSEAGSYGIGWIALFAIVGIANDGLKRGAVAGACVVLMLGTNTLIKNVIRRPRPLLRAIEHAPKTFSMPSAHSSMAMVGASTMQVIAPEQAILWWTVAALLAASRVMLGMHFLSDVLVGTALGLAAGIAIAMPVVASV